MGKEKVACNLYLMSLHSENLGFTPQCIRRDVKEGNGSCIYFIGTAKHPEKYISYQRPDVTDKCERTIAARRQPPPDIGME